MVRRWHSPRLPPLDRSYQGPDITAIISSSLREAANMISALKIPESPTMNAIRPTPPIGRPCCDGLWIVTSSSTCLLTISSPTQVTSPMETVRVFAIDHAWVWAMVDGGLSLANHL
ncbi:hypothetical protein BDV40DRAFT_257043, partial [Aspergillus tamarii]